MTSRGESEPLFEAGSIPSPTRPLFQTAFDNFDRRSPTAVDIQNPDRRHSLAIEGRRSQSGDFALRWWASEANAPAPCRGGLR